MNLSHEAETTLLLCGHWKSDEHYSPLSNKEFARIVGWAGQHGFTIGSLLDEEGMLCYSGSPVADIPPSRIEGLIGRRDEMTAHVGKWLDSGFWILCREDPSYPAHLTAKLDYQAPPLLYGYGDAALMSLPAIAIVGSRSADAGAVEFALKLGASAARVDIRVVSGGAQGVDSFGMKGALDEGGKVVGVLPGDLARSVSSSDMRVACESGRLTLISLHKPDAPFTVGAAMERNKAIYALSDAAVIVSCDSDKGGTWAGAEENARRKWVPAFVRDDPDLPGNAKLVKNKWGRWFPLEALDDPNLLLETDDDSAETGTLGLGL